MSLVLSANASEGAGTLQDDLMEKKRHSRSLDLEPNARMRLHQRSASESDGIDIIAATEQKILPSVVASSVPTTKEETTVSNSVFSLYKKLGSPRRNRSFTSNNNTKGFTSKSRASIGSAFSSFRQPSLSNMSTNTTTASSTTAASNNISKKNRFSTPVNNPGMWFDCERRCILTAV